MVREWPYFGIHFMIADGDILRKNLWFADSDILGSPLRFVGGQIPGGGVLPYMAYTGMCRWSGYGFWPLCPKQGM